MYFNSVDEIPSIASHIGCSVFVLPKEIDFEIKNAFVITTEKKTVITIEQVRDILTKLMTKQTSDVFVVIRPADALGEEASNALLKSLEEPKDKVHFILVTDSPSRLLPTILSRSELYMMRKENILNEDLKADKKVRELAKRLVVAKPSDLVGLAEEITKKKDGVRGFAMDVVATAIEMLYKSYFKTNNDLFVKKIPKFLNCYDAISRNGHLKLHLVADLL